MRKNTVVIETLFSQRAYSHAQLKRACRIASAVGRPVFVLCEPPEKCVRCLDEPETFCTECGAISDA